MVFSCQGNYRWQNNIVKQNYFNGHTKEDTLLSLINGNVNHCLLLNLNIISFAVHLFAADSLSHLLSLLLLLNEAKSPVRMKKERKTHIQ